MSQIDPYSKLTSIAEDLRNADSYHDPGLPSAAHVATDPLRVYDLGAGFNPAMLRGPHLDLHARRSEATPR